MATRKKKEPTTRLTIQLLDMFRNQLRVSLGKTRTFKRDLKNIGEELKHEKKVQAELYRMVSGLERALEDKKIAALAETILGIRNT